MKQAGYAGAQGVLVRRWSERLSPLYQDCVICKNKIGAMIAQHGRIRAPDCTHAKLQRNLGALVCRARPV